MSHRRLLLASGGAAGWTPAQDPNILYWWVASDLANGAVSSWTDRIKGSNLIQTVGANQPTKTSGNFISFDVNSLLLSNAIPNILAPYTMFWIVSTTNNSKMQFFLGFGTADDTFDYDWTVGGYDGIRQGAGVCHGNTIDGSTVFDTIATVAAPGYDVVWYTNGVLQVNVGGVCNFSDWQSGGAAGMHLGGKYDVTPANSFIGRVYEVAIITNNMNVTYRDLWHNYATNTYAPLITP